MKLWPRVQDVLDTLITWYCTSGFRQSPCQIARGSFTVLQIEAGLSYFPRSMLRGCARGHTSFMHAAFGAEHFVEVEIRPILGGKKQHPVASVCKPRHGVAFTHTPSKFPRLRNSSPVPHLRSEYHNTTGRSSYVAQSSLWRQSR
jgi:hypothetical protein